MPNPIGIKVPAMFRELEVLGKVKGECWEVTGLEKLTCRPCTKY